MQKIRATRSLDITNELLAAFAAAGSPAGVVSSYTGQGLEADWLWIGVECSDAD
jgi:hypothetical protein